MPPKAPPPVTDFVEQAVDPDEMLRGFIEHAIAEADRFLASGETDPEDPGVVARVREARDSLLKLIGRRHLDQHSAAFFGLNILSFIDQVARRKQMLADAIAARDAERRAKGSATAQANRACEPVDPVLAAQIRAVLAGGQLDYTRITKKIKRQRQAANQSEVSYDTIRRACVALGIASPRSRRR
jgi:hypothetical protein